MPRQSQRHRTTVLPFPYRGQGLDFDLEMYSTDGGKPTDFDLKPGQTRVDLPGAGRGEDGAERSWDEALVYGELVVPDDVVADVFPEPEREAPPAKLYVAVRCHETIFRDSVDVAHAPTEPGSYDVTIKLRREVLRGEVELRPYLVRTEPGETDEGYATTPNAHLASETGYTVVVDRSADDTSASIDGEEASFSRADHLPDGDKLYYLDFRNESRPKLWLNADHPRITDVLQTEGSVGAEPRMRDVILDQVSYGVWHQLILRTAAAIDEDGEVEYDWQQTVLEAFGRELYGVDDVTEAAHRLRAEVATPDGLARLAERIDGELQEYIDPRTQLINLMEEGLQI